MITIGSETKAMISRVKESLSKEGQPLREKQEGNYNFIEMESPYTTISDKTVMKFVYGVSEYGGEDLVQASSIKRNRKRYFSIIT